MGRSRHLEGDEQQTCARASQPAHICIHTLLSCASVCSVPAIWGLMYHWQLHFHIVWLFFFFLHIFLFPVTKNNRTDKCRRFTSGGAGKIQATYSKHGRGIVRTINTRPFIRKSPCSKIICIVSIYFPRPRGHFRIDKRLEGVRMPSGIQESLCCLNWRLSLGWTRYSRGSVAQNPDTLLYEVLELVHMHYSWLPAGIVNSISGENGSAGILDSYLCYT